jgi:hypothetical protein
MIKLFPNNGLRVKLIQDYFKFARIQTYFPKCRQYKLDLTMRSGLVLGLSQLKVMIKPPIKLLLIFKVIRSEFDSKIALSLTKVQSKSLKQSVKMRYREHFTDLDKLNLIKFGWLVLDSF